MCLYRNSGTIAPQVVDMPALILLLALALDLLLGDPPNRYRPVVLMGNYSGVIGSPVDARPHIVQWSRPQPHLMNQYGRA